MRPTLLGMRSALLALFLTACGGSVEPSEEPVPVPAPDVAAPDADASHEAGVEASTEAEGGCARSVAITGAPCAVDGLRACADQKTALICSGGMWTLWGTCAGQLTCETSPGPYEGQCVSTPIACR